MARALGLRHRELHVGEEAARAALADVALGLVVRRGGRRADGVEPELLAELARGPTPRTWIVCRPCRRFGSTRTAAPRCSSSRRCPTRSPGRARCSSGCARRRSTTSTSGSARACRRCRSRGSSAPTAPASSKRSARASTGFEPGERVVINPGVEAGDGAIHVIGEHGDGTNAELIAVPATNVYPIPGDLSFEEAAAFPLVFETAYRMLVTRARLQAGEWVLLWGIGSGVSTAGPRDREGARRADDRHLVERREARAGARARRRRDGEPRERRREGGREGGDRRPRRRRRRRARRRGDVAHVARRRRARGAHRGLRRDDRPEPAGGAAPRLVEAADDPRLDDGDARPTSRAPTS